MCGFVGILTPWGHRPSITEIALGRMNDRLEHRGPDGSGTWFRGPAALAHRRLKVVDLTDAGAQPMAGADRALVYNGEIYNDPELRDELLDAGVDFESSCDTETLFRLLERHGSSAIDRLRGMYAFAWVDLAQRTATLARDPLGIKPLYYTHAEIDGVASVVFASEIPAILEHPAVSARPDPVGVSSYLTTLRTVLDDRTMFDGIHAVRPGEVLEIDLSDERLPVTVLGAWSPQGRDSDVLGAVRDSVRAHLRADVPTCCLLSGGLDSTLITALAKEQDASLSTYCAGSEDGQTDDDLSFAERGAAHLGVRHVRAPITRELFLTRWPRMVEAMGVPVSTPNEIAINEVARVLRAEDKVVALSGEGADELFAGYAAPLELAAAHVESGNDRPGGFQLRAHAWMDPSIKPAALQPEFWHACGQDDWLERTFERVYRESADEAGVDSPMEAHLRMHRRINLTGLLGRLDSATMLESVEGRTPLADRRIVDLAASIPFAEKASMSGGRISGTKVPLRRGAEGIVHPDILTRPKASFPLPFQSWIGGAVQELMATPFLMEVYTPGAIASIASDPVSRWNLAWPMANLALWGRRWWGR